MIDDEAQRALLASYSGKLCPYLTIAGLKQGGGLVGVNIPSQSEAIGCQGPNCALFAPIADENGRVCSGGCGVALLPTAVAQGKDARTQIARVNGINFNPSMKEGRWEDENT